MTNEEKVMLQRINDYANEVMPDIDPQKTRISEQLDKLRPILQTLAMEQQRPVEDVFIHYMDLATDAAVEREKNFQSIIDDSKPAGDPSFSAFN